MKVNIKDDVVMQAGLTGSLGVAPSSINENSTIHIRGIKNTLEITREVEMEFIEKYGYVNPFTNNKVLELMNIALRHSQYINYQEI